METILFLLILLLIVAITCIIVQRTYLGKLRRVNSNLYKDNVAMVEEIYKIRNNNGHVH